MHTTQSTAIDTEGVCTGQRGAVLPGDNPWVATAPAWQGMALAFSRD